MAQAIATELTFHYIDGRNESFTIYEPIQPSVLSPDSTAQNGSAKDENPNASDPFQQHVRHLMGKAWRVLHLPEKSVLINMDTVVKVEINPPIVPQSDDIVAQVEGGGARLLDAMPDV